jgi:hypothetical protein
MLQAKSTIPIAWVYLKRYRGDSSSWVVPDCPYCYGQHTHGAGPEHCNPLEYLDPPRSSHCGGGGSYKLVPFDPDKPTRKKWPS